MVYVGSIILGYHILKVSNQILIRGALFIILMQETQLRMLSMPIQYPKESSGNVMTGQN